MVLVRLALSDSDGGKMCVTDDVFVSLGSRLHEGLTSLVCVRNRVSEAAGEAVGVWTRESVLGRMALALGSNESDGVVNGEAVGDGAGGWRDGARERVRQRGARLRPGRRRQGQRPGAAGLAPTAAP